MNVNDVLWWQKGVVYQVYPRSFQDSNGDGIGDLKGIIRRLDYLKWLNIDALWLSPIFPSPMADFGYDVSDYTGIHPLFGDMEDFDELLVAAHAKGLKVILDFVPNHTSDQHPWFLESRSSRSNPKRDWYLWKDPAEDGKEPNNWLSVFGGSGWEYDNNTDQYYYHAFLKEQPDLNWRNPEVQREMLNAMEFWLRRGVDGFRVDVIWHMIKDENFRDNPINPDYKPHMSPYSRLSPVYSTDQAEVHQIIKKMRAVTDKYNERLLIGEIYLPVSQLVTYYGNDLSGVHLPFNFQLVVLPWEPLLIYNTINEYEGAIPEGGWPNWVLGNHDKSRIATRIGRAQARVAAMLLLTLRGTPTLYYGDELGMEDVSIPCHAVQDPQEKNIPGLGLGRDPERTPMQWDTSKNAGFTSGSPWLPVASDFPSYNVESEESDPASLLNYYRDLLQLRREQSALSIGKFLPIHGDEKCIYYQRSHGQTTFLVGLNFTREKVAFSYSKAENGKVILGTRREREGSLCNGDIELQPDEGLIIQLDASLAEA